MLVLSAFAYLLGWSNIFSVEKITINEKDRAIVAELKAKLAESPAVIEIGQPIARVDRRALQNRLRTLIWIDQVNVKRDFLSGVVEVSVTPRSAVAQLDQSWPIKTGVLGFLSDDLELFYVPQAEVEKAARSGEVDWRSLPSLALGSDEVSLKKDVAKILQVMPGISARPLRISAPNSENLQSKVLIDGRTLDISWGSVKELELKERVLARLLEIKANRKVTKIDLTSPLSPIVR